VEILGSPGHGQAQAKFGETRHGVP